MFKVGEFVRVKGKVTNGWVPDMDKYVGQVWPIEEVRRYGENEYYYKIDDWLFDERELESDKKAKLMSLLKELETIVLEMP